MRDSPSLTSLATRKPERKTESKPGYYTHLNYQIRKQPQPHAQKAERTIIEIGWITLEALPFSEAAVSINKELDVSQS
ncbi:hypothetical protein CDL15_Pgr005197 [Punica granatum]|nr:hypothetical protein CDL15_Pgr005197 [Punica granatum]